MTFPAPSDSRFLFLLASARREGNTETLARHAAATLPAGTSRTWLRLDEHPLPPFADLRHASPEPWRPEIGGHAQFLADATLAATDIVFVAPIYWYSLPASAKLYLDHWTAWLRVPGLNFKERMAGKSLWAVTALNDNNPAFASPLIETLRLTAEYMQMHWRGTLLGEGNRPGDVRDNTATLARASAFFTAPQAG